MKCKCPIGNVEPCNIKVPTITRQEIREGMNGENSWIESMEQNSNNKPYITINSVLFRIV